MITNKTEFWLMNNPVRRLMLRFEVRKLRQMSPVGNIERALEIGCGEGRSTKNIVRYFKPKSIDAIDLDPKMIQRAKKNNNSSGINFSQGDASKLSSIEDNTYDVIFDCGVIHHIPNWQDCLQELYRVLKPGGYLHIEDLSIESFQQPVIGKILHKYLDHPYKEMYTRKQFEDKLKELEFNTLNKIDFIILRPFWMVLQK